MVGHQRGGAALERVEHELGQLGRAEGRVRRHAHGAAEQRASGSGRTAARRARRTARWPSARACAPPRRRRSGGRRRGAARARRWARARRRPPRRRGRTTRHLLGLELGQHGAGGRDGDQIAGARADVPGRAEHEPLGGEHAGGAPRPALVRGPAERRTPRERIRRAAPGTLRQCRSDRVPQPSSPSRPRPRSSARPPSRRPRARRSRLGAARADITPAHRLPDARLGTRRRSRHRPAHAPVRRALVLQRVARGSSALVCGGPQHGGRRDGPGGARGRLPGRRGDRPGHPHPRRPDRVLELPLQGRRLPHAKAPKARASTSPTRCSTRSWCAGSRWRSPGDARSPAAAALGARRCSA